MSRYTLSEATEIICEGSGLNNPELWVARRLRAGIFPGLKIGRDWFMTDRDVKEALESCRRSASPLPEELPQPKAVSIADGLSARARKLRAS